MQEALTGLCERGDNNRLESVHCHLSDLIELVLTIAEGRQ